MPDLLDLLLAKPAPSMEDRIELQTGAFYWRSSGTTPAEGVSYGADIPAGLHFGAGSGRMVTVMGGRSIAFNNAVITRFRLAEPLACTTQLVGRRRWASLGIWIALDSPLFHEFSAELPSLPDPSHAPAHVIAMLSGSMTARYTGVAHAFALRSEAYALLAACSATSGHQWKSADARRAEAVEAAWLILQAEYADPPSLGELARRVGVNRRYLTGDFRKRFGRSIAAEITALRLRHAYDMLEAGLQVGEVALRVGYSPSHFAVAYRRRFGHPPSHRG